MRKLLVAIAVCVSSFAVLAAEPNYVVTRIRFYPRAGQAQRMTVGRFAGSTTSATNDFALIAEVKDAPVDGQWTEIALPQNAKAFRFIKFESPRRGFGNVAEIEFYHDDMRLTGTPFGTVGATNNANNQPEFAFDGKTDTYFEGTGSDNQYVGIDLGDASQAATPVASLKSGRYAQAQTVTFATTTAGATIKVNNRPYDKPVAVGKSMVLTFVASKPGLADSVAGVAAYKLGESTAGAKEVSSFHIGNSLTDTVNGWMMPLATSAGHQYRYHRFTIPGAPTDWLWDHPGTGFGDNRVEQAFLAYAPINNLVTQPFAGHSRSIDNEAQYSGKFWDVCRQHTPDVQMWLYVQWPGPDFKDNWAKGTSTFAGKAVKISEPAKTWQEGVANHVRYTELVRDEMNKQHAELISAGKARPVLIIPGGIALAKLKTRMEEGKIPGMTDFLKEVFADGIHMTSKGAYLVSLVHYGCILKEDPTGKVTTAKSGLTDEQAKIFQQIAWETVQEYPFDGVGK